jgi:hypothetical protein
VSRQRTYHFEARLNSLVKSKQGIFLKVELTPNDIPDELSTAAVGQRFMIAVSEIGDMDEDLGEGERAVQLAGILCRTPDFQEYMVKIYDQPGITPTEDSAARILKDYLHLKSRADLKDNVKARRHFGSLKDSYDQWLVESGKAL